MRLSRNAAKVAVVILTVIGGTGTTLFKKGAFQTSAENSDGELIKFKHPFFITWMMVVSETCTIAIRALISRKQNRKARKSLSRSPRSDVTSGEDSAVELVDRNSNSVDMVMFLSSNTETAHSDEVAADEEIPFYVFALISFVDLGGTATGALGLMYGVQASIYQVLKGASTLFVAAFSAFFLRRRFYSFHVLGLVCITMGITLAGLTNTFAKHAAHPTKDSEEEVDQNDKLIGLGFVLLGQFLHAIQAVAEEKYLKQRNLSPMEIVGKTGAWGVFFVSLIILPITSNIYVDDGHGKTRPYDHPFDAFTQMSHSAQLTGFVMGYFCCIVISNVFGLSITKLFSAVHRTIVNCAKTGVIWILAIIMHMVDPTLGETLSYWSCVELVGFGLFILGIMIYNGFVTRLVPSGVQPAPPK